MREADLSTAQWHKSSYSSGDGGENCVEVATGVDGVVPVRDSKVQGGRALVIGAAAWRAFIREVAR
ncbi:DUF397 domain-containing protein [Streptomyces spectabilis]|uniref:DUF397 domain-containing protein n=1 Tax=Streptomyces spectabilis TaxID=68270 RepID=A0A5P2X9P4_STRST|nr:DUF397 domain-containing protein [Streptomyces spectabilis]MBB5103410.1 hypothetical protein [Streptomyces spectabilis]MCI3902600.1 DUF397 domain-containing protein [Streptomyces spectabilis]QEV59925.1 DUF397 domain-containing protein [Streptomyces spectabilis]GGV48985.1 hypothetical protein GCM10010245_77110 [Streptomyces spectabilis]